MQLVNDSPIANSQPVAIASLELGDVVVLGIGIGGDFLDLPHNALLAIRRKPRQRLSEGFCGDDRIHNSIVTLSNNARQVENRRTALASTAKRGCPYVNMIGALNPHRGAALLEFLSRRRLIRSDASYRDFGYEIVFAFHRDTGHPPPLRASQPVAVR